MRTLLLLCILCSLHFLSQAQNYSRAKIFANEQGFGELSALGIPVDHGEVKFGQWLISDFSAAEITLVKQHGFEVEILIQDVQAFYRNQNRGGAINEKNTSCEGDAYTAPANPTHWNHGTMGGFLTYQQFLDEVDEMAAAYPNLITPRAQIGTFTTYQGRPLYWMRISDNSVVDEDEPEVLYTAVHHAREPNSLSEVIFYMWHLLENYGTDPEITYLIDSTEMYFVPMVNPDGYIYNESTDPSGGGMWRKNRRPNAGGSFGVDLNRNYSHGWNTTGVSSQPSGDTWPGTAPFSEPETQAIKWFCENHHFRYAFNAHTYGNDLLFPIGTTSNDFAEDHDYFQAFTSHMVEHNGYAAFKSSSLYPASGDSDDYMYLMDTVIKPKIFAMTPEVSNTTGGFWPAENEIDQICRDMVFPNLILAHLTMNYYRITETDPATIGTLTGYFHHESYRLGQGNEAVNVSIEPLTGIVSVGNAAVHQTAIMDIKSDSISFTLNPSIQNGDPIRYVLVSDFGGWIKRDTIEKIFGEVPTQFTDDASTVANWTGNWATTTSAFVSPSTSFTDSPFGNYSNNTTRNWQFSQTVDLTGSTAASIRFWAKWEIEQGYDYVQFQVSTDGGTTWEPQCGRYTVSGSSLGGAQDEGEPLWDGIQTNWVREEINLSQYVGQQIKFRFQLKTDAGSTDDGFYFDDFEIAFDTVSTTGLSELHNSGILYPNPANTYVNVSLPQAQAGYTITLVDVNGKMVRTEQYSGISGNIGVPVSELDNGIYELILTSDSGSTERFRVVVLH